MQKLKIVRLLFVVCLLSIAYTAVNAQAVPDIRIKEVYAITRIYKTGKINPIPEGTKYEIIAPPFTFNDHHLNFNCPNIFFNSDGKRAKKKDTADITFKLICPGVVDLRENLPVYSRGVDEFHTGYTMTFSYHFPVSIEVLNKKGDLQQTIILIDENDTFEEVYHASFLQEPAFASAFSAIPWNRFTFADSCYNSSLRLRGQIAQRMSMNRWSNLISVLSRVLTSGYGSEKIPGNAFYGVYTVRDPTPEDAELVALCDRTKAAITNIGDKEKQAASIAEFIVLQDEFEKRLKADLPKNVKSLCNYNAAVCALFNGQTEKSLDYYYKALNRPRPDVKLFKTLNTYSNKVQDTSDNYWSLMTGLCFYGQVPDPKAETIIMKNYLQQSE
jgi:hypothetical protein